MERTFTCNLCEALCGLRVEIEQTPEGERVGRIRGDPEDVISHGHICPKAHALGELAVDPDSNPRLLSAAWCTSHHFIRPGETLRCCSRS